jgi:glycosyltransferase involved in cell wall biosynthesis
LSARLAVLVRDLGGGGVQRSLLTLAKAFAERGHPVDLVTSSDAGVLRSSVPPEVRLVVLPTGRRHLARLLPLVADPLGARTLLPAMLTKARPSPTLASLGALARYLRRERPTALVTGITQVNLEAVWAKRLARWRGRLVITERVHFSSALAESSAWRQRHLPGLVRRTYPKADAIVAVADAVADDLSAATGLARGSIRTIYNPIVGREVAVLADAPVPHPWLDGTGPPVVLGVGRLDEQKDHPTLLRAFAAAAGMRPLRLIILGEGRRPEDTSRAQRELMTLAANLGVADAVSLPGFTTNPFAYMARAAVLVLSSRLEGLPAVLVQAMACGCPVVSTDCPSGPREILEGGRWGPLVPVGDHRTMAAAILSTLAHPGDRSARMARAAVFSVEQAADRYLELMLASGSRRDG